MVRIRKRSNKERTGFRTSDIGAGGKEFNIQEDLIYKNWKKNIKNL